MEHTKAFPKLVRGSELSTIVPYSMNHIRRLEEAGQFPKRIRIGANRVGWVRAEVEQWLNDRMGAR
jgi:prophage regulatory protein